MDEHGGAVVEEVGVVDQDEERSPAGLVEQVAGVVAQEFGMGLGTYARRSGSLGEERGESAEGEAPSGLGAGHHGDRHPLVLSEFDADHGQGGLADSGRSRDHRAVLPRDGVPQPADLPPSTDHRPTTPFGTLPHAGATGVNGHRIRSPSISLVNPFSS